MMTIPLTMLARTAFCVRLNGSRVAGFGKTSLSARTALTCRKTNNFSTAAVATDDNAGIVLSHPATVDGEEGSRGRIVCVTSGKGGVGKTTISASLAVGLASRGRKTCVVDFDIGLRNLDIHLGLERRIVFDIVNVLTGECALHQALLKDKRQPNLSLLAASQTKDKDCLTVEGVEKVLAGLTDSFDYVVLDSPAGIESGARHAMYFADDAVIVTQPELSSCRDADKMIGFIDSKSRRAELGPGEAKPVSMSLLINRYDAKRAQAEECLAIADITELLGLPVVGIVPESKEVLPCTNLGQPAILLDPTVPVAGAFQDTVDRFLGEEREMRFTTVEPVSFFSRIFG
jgi:septum site-determining protein MinD